LCLELWISHDNALHLLRAYYADLATFVVNLMKFSSLFHADLAAPLGFAASPVRSVSDARVRGRIKSGARGGPDALLRRQAKRTSGRQNDALETTGDA
jgi:hypothetical protein